MTVDRKGDLNWVSNCRRIEVEEEVCRGRVMNAWGGRMDQLMKKSGLRLEMAVDRNSWRNGSVRVFLRGWGCKRGGLVESDSVIFL